MQLYVLMFRQDDPKKCTAAKIVKFKIATGIRKTISTTLLLDPFAEKILLHKDRLLVDSLTGIDCSWELAHKVFNKKFLGVARKLPPLLAGNPVNYSKINKLTTAEAMAAAAFILGFEDLSKELLDKFKWGHTFYDLNNDLLADYLKAESKEEVDSIVSGYGLKQ